MVEHGLGSMFVSFVFIFLVYTALFQTDALINNNSIINIEKAIIPKKAYINYVWISFFVCLLFEYAYVYPSFVSLFNINFIYVH